MRRTQTYNAYNDMGLEHMSVYESKNCVDSISSISTEL